MANHSWLNMIALIAASALILAVPFFTSIDFGTVDFRPYWSSTYLLAHGQDFSNKLNLDHIERSLTDWTGSFTMFAWFTPIGNLILLPYIFFPFKIAAYYWLITNIIILFLSAALIWRNNTKALWVPFLAIFGFSMTLVSLFYGQVNTLVLFGLILYLHFHEKNQDFAAGACLILTAIKPHLVVLTLPLLLLDIIRRKQWRALAGLGSALVACFIILFAIHPGWIIRFFNLALTGMNTIRETPAFAGLLTITGHSALSQILWIPVLFASLIFCWKCGKEWSQRNLIDISIIASLWISPFGWSYDQIILLLPVIHILDWIVKGSLNKRDAIGVIASLVVINAITIYQRSFTPNDVWFFWVPLSVAAIYLYASLRKRSALKTITGNSTHQSEF